MTYKKIPIIFFIFFLVVCVKHTPVLGNAPPACTDALKILNQRKLNQSLFDTVNKRHPKLKKIKRLIDQGANVNARFKSSNKTLAHIVKSVPVLTLLVENGLQLTTVDKYSMNRLHYAYRRNTSLELIQAFIDLSGENKNILLDQGTTPLMMLASHGQSKRLLRKIMLLIDNGSDVNAATKNGLTALHKAAKWGHLKVAELLIENGADVNAEVRSKSINNNKIRYMLPIDVFNANSTFESFIKNAKANSLLKPTKPRILDPR